MRVMQAAMRALDIEDSHPAEVIPGLGYWECVCACGWKTKGYAKTPRGVRVKHRTHVEQKIREDAGYAHP